MVRQALQGDQGVARHDHSSQRCGNGAHFSHDVRIMRPKELQKFKGAVRAFFASMSGDLLTDLSKANTRAAKSSQAERR